MPSFEIQAVRVCAGMDPARVVAYIDAPSGGAAIEILGLLYGGHHYAIISVRPSDVPGDSLFVVG